MYHLYINNKNYLLIILKLHHSLLQAIMLIKMVFQMNIILILIHYFLIMYA